MIHKIEHNSLCETESYKGMTDNEIIKALESLLDKMRAYETSQASIGKGVVEHIISMYDRQKAEITEKDETIKAQADTIFLYEQVIKDKKAEIERLRHEYSNAVLTIESKDSFIEYLQDYAKERKIEEFENRGIKKFIRRFKAELHKCSITIDEYLEVSGCIDNLVKEMTEQ